MNKNQKGRQGQEFDQPANPPKKNKIIKKIIPFIGAALVGFGAFLYRRYRIASPNEYIVRTGFLIRNINITKKCIQLPLQKVTTLDLTPKSYSLTIHAMSNEKMEFILPCVFTIGPKDESDDLIKFSKYLIGENAENLTNIIKGIIEGETRVLAANLSVEQIFKDRQSFKLGLIKKIEEELTILGMTVYNANIKELQDSKDSKYFTSLAQKISAEAENQAKIDIADANKRGAIGHKEREGLTRQKTAEIESTTVIIENERKIEMAKSQGELDEKRAQYSYLVQIAQIESQKNAEKRSEELQKEVEMKKIERVIERERAEHLSKAKVKAEIEIAEASGDSSALRTMAEANLFKKQKEAKATLLLYQAKAEGIRKISEALNNDNNAVLTYLMIENNIYPQLAEASAKAVQGLNPKITVWNTGGDKSNYDPIVNLIKSVPPMLDAIQDQTKIKIPDFMRQDIVENVKLNKL